ncbi:TonB-dependent receptor plug domain-containing protein [Thaumasiovibrio subtropicus]|uniref:TonB-dependent receptor plug domain-containing protein n=1 Tax=Thaumasiovibrio subtropicus TaxID=1891207 RepID=UPI000B35CD8A|nr:TonB-dependent receptor [Thaumasiovibrio subtropicus]
MKLLKLSCAVAAALVSQTGFASEAGGDNEVVVVTATSYEQTLREAPASISVIDSAEINRVPASDITEALKGVAGIQIDKTWGDEPSIKIRGLDSDFTLLLINGRRINSREAIVRGAFDMSSIPMSAIERVEVVRGPMSALYGSEALGGVVNIILKQPTNDIHAAGRVGFSSPATGGGDLNQVGGYVGGALIEDKLLFSANVDYTDRDIWAITENDPTSSNTLEGQERLGFMGDLTWLATDNDTFIVDFSHMEDDRVSPRSNNDPDEHSYYESKRLRAGLAYNRVWSWGDTYVNYYYEDAEIMEDNSHPALTVANGKQNNQNFDARAVFGFGSNHWLTVGLDYGTTELKHDRDYKEKADNSQVAVYIQDEIQITDPFKLVLSGRYTDHSEFGSNFSPRVYGVYNASEKLTIKGGVGSGFKAPAMWRSSDQFVLISCGGRCWLVGNPDLKPETSVSYELSAHYAEDNWSLQVGGFLNDVEDMIYRDTANRYGSGPGGLPYIKHINLNEVRTQGIEIDGRYDPSDVFSFSANLTITDSEDKTTGNELENTPRYISNLAFNWYPTQDLQFYTRVNIIGPQKDWARKQPDGTYTQNELSAYETVDVGGSVYIHPNIQFKAGITNIGDTRLERETVETGQVEQGRIYYASLDFEY